jgi:serine/threonine protein kinase
MDETAEAFYRAVVASILATNDQLMRITVKVGANPCVELPQSPHRGRVSRLQALLKKDVLTLEAQDLDEYMRWRTALVVATSCSFPKYYKRGHQIGHGHFSNVYIATDKVSGEQFAVKIVKRDRKNPAKMQKYVRREVSVLSTTDHENLVKAVDFFECRERPHIVMEYIPSGSLKDMVLHRGRLSETEARPIMQGILRGVAYLHSLGIVHRDIKPDNILMHTRTHPKITDFGLSIFLRGEGELVRSLVGTPAYCAPEICAGVPYGPASDAWSCGILLYYVLSGTRPFHGQTKADLKSAIMRGSLDFPAKSFRFVGRKARLLMSSLLTVDQAKRLTPADALHHEWFIGSP